MNRKDKKCPFCKSDVEFYGRETHGSDSHVRCLGCGAMFFFGPFTSVYELLHRWNNRYNRMSFFKRMKRLLKA